MGFYYIVTKGEQPGNEGREILDTVCAEWSASRDRATTEVVEADLAGNVIRRLPASESEQVARAYRKLAS